MTLSEIRANVRRLIHNRTDLTDSDLDSYINDAYLAMARGRFFDADRTRRPIVLHFSELEKEDTSITLDGTNAIHYYDFPADAAAVQEVEFQYDSTNDKYRPLIRKSRRNFDELDTVRGHDPIYWTTFNRKIYITPRPGTNQDGKKLRVLYYAIPTKLDPTNDDSPVFPEPYHMALVYLAASTVLAHLSEPEMADDLFIKFMRRLQEITDDGQLSIRPAFNRPTPVRWLGQ